ncbi:hypothetical protein B0H19DRAFT_1110929 [Mycena capillaripes]|nr:hypothetical protein B0H19DRAFT_1110929 [Mycena capillaripes]
MAPGPIAFISWLRTGFSQTQGLSPQQLLPMELWETIFHQLSPPDRELIRLCAVCTTFHSLCIHILLTRYNLSEEIFSDHNPRIPGSLLAALHFSLRSVFPFERFECELAPHDLHQNLRFLREILHRSKSLRDLHLIFHEDLFDQPSQETLLNAFCTVLSGMVMRAGGPVIIVSDTRIFSCRPHDIAGWQLHLFRFDRSLTMGVRHALNLPQSASGYLSSQTKITIHDGSIVTVSPLTQLHSVTVQGIEDPLGRLGSFSILTFNADVITSLSLGQQTHKTLSAPGLSAAIIHISLPALRQLTIWVDYIDPAVLSRFLMNHPTLEEFDYQGEKGVSPDPAPPSHTGILVDPPVAHPRLTTLRTSNLGMGSAVAGLDTSPSLHTFSFIFPIDPPPAALAGLVSDLWRISSRRNDTVLNLGLSQSRESNLENYWAANDNVRMVAHALQCVRTVDIHCRGCDIGVLTLPWLALLPAVSTVRFTFRRRFGMEFINELAAFLEEARAALPRVAHVTGEQI